MTENNLTSIIKGCVDLSAQCHSELCLDCNHFTLKTCSWMSHTSGASYGATNKLNIPSGVTVWASETLTYSEV